MSHNYSPVLAERDVWTQRNPDLASIRYYSDLRHQIEEHEDQCFFNNIGVRKGQFRGLSTEELTKLYLKVG